MTKGHENRRSFRISESVFLKFDRITDQEYHDGLERRKMRLGIDTGASAKLVDIDARLSQAMYMLNAESDSVGKCITLLNDKLNIVIDQLPAFKETKAKLAQLPPQVCDVSADGMVFSAEQPIPVGTKLHLQFLLESDSRFMETFCKVVRAADSPADDPKLPHGVAVEFHGMKSEQREILIQHMFSRESETLRMRRLELDAIED